MVNGETAHALAIRPATWLILFAFSFSCFSRLSWFYFSHKGHKEHKGKR